MPVPATVNTQWTPAAPGGSDNPKQGDDEIRALKLAIEQRMQNGGHLWPSGVEATAGKIACGVQAVNTLTLYETDGGTPAMVFNDSSKTCTLGDGTTGANRYNFIVGGTLNTRGAMAGNVTLISTAAYTIATTDFVVGFTYNGTVDVTLPLANQLPGRFLFLKRAASPAATNQINVARAGADTIEGATTAYVFADSTNYECVKLQNDGVSNWLVVGGYAI